MKNDALTEAMTELVEEAVEQRFQALKVPTAQDIIQALGHALLNAKEPGKVSKPAKSKSILKLRGNCKRCTATKHYGKCRRENLPATPVVAGAARNGKELAKA